MNKGLNMNRVESYFDKKAGGYETGRKKGLLGRMVSGEVRAAMEMLDVKKGDRILDCGCGTGTYGKLIKGKGGRYLGIDISENMVREARRNGLKAKRCAMEKFHPGDSEKKFDKILVSGSLEFCQNPGHAIRRCTKNLKRGGLLVIIAPRRNIPGLMYFAYHIFHGIHIKLFSKKNLRRSMKEAGFLEDGLAWSKPNHLVFVLSGRKDFSS
ncbi:MAG: class I SAM-dependent methyltransferase [archaeon]